MKLSGLSNLQNFYNQTNPSTRLIRKTYLNNVNATCHYIIYDKCFIRKLATNRDNTLLLQRKKSVVTIICTYATLIIKIFNHA